MSCTTLLLRLSIQGTPVLSLNPMEYYNPAHTQQLAPLVTLSLGSGDFTTILKEHFEKANVCHKLWDDSILKNRLLNAKYILRYASTEESVYEKSASHKQKLAGTHSELSPFNVDSDLFPNGILSSRWFKKYTEELPCAVIQIVDLGEDSSVDEGLGISLSNLRQKYTDVGVKFISIVVSSSENSNADADRVAVLRQISGLPRLSGLFYLNTDPKTVDRDCGVLTSTIFNNLRATATDFYSSIEHRIKQRYKKYYTLPAMNYKATGIELTPKFLEIRNLIKQAMISQFMHPHNVEPSLTTLEYSYERLMELMRELIVKFFDESITSHHVELYNQFRRLLDILAIHLIRGYLSVEEPVAALRKHGDHVLNVLDLTKGRPEIEIKIWLSIQYQWLAELMSLVPKTVLRDLNSVAKAKNKANQKSISYYGGITFHDNFSSKVVTHPSLVYLKAASVLSGLEFQSTKLSYLQVFQDSKGVKQHKIELLELAKKAVSDHLTSQEKTMDLEGLENYLDWQMAEENIAIGNFREAVRHYKLILAKNTSKGWKSISELVKQRLVYALQELDDDKELLTTLASMSISKFGRFPQVTPKWKSDLDIDLEEGPNLLKLELVLFNKTLANDSHAFDTIVTQLKLKSMFDSLFLQESIPGSKVELTIEKLEVAYNNEKVVELTNADSGSDEFQEVNVTETTKFSVNFNGHENEKVIQLQEEVANPGWYRVENVKAYLKIRLTGSGTKVIFSRTEIYPFGDSSGQAHSAYVFTKAISGKLEKKLTRLHGQSPAAVFVQPYRPQITAKMMSPLTNLIVGEKLNLSFTITYEKLPQQKVNFASISLVLKSKILENEIEIDTFTVQTNWDSMKDDEPLNILEMETNSSTRNLQVSVSRPPNVESILQNNLALVLDLRILVGESSGEISAYELQTYELPVVVEPFTTTFSVSPRCRDDGSLDLPNPFVLSSDSEQPEKDYSMPLPSRVWLAKLNLVDNLGLLRNGTIEVGLYQVALRSKNPEVLVENIEEPSKLDMQVRQLFVTRNKHRFTHRNVAVVGTAKFSWKRCENEFVNEFETKEWDVILPLQDPRVLLQVERLGNQQVKLKYTMENPTPRILTFTTTMATENAALHGSVWNFDNPDTVVPMKQSAFPVLPFSRHEMIFVGSYELDEDKAEVELPQLQVYDVNYKVSLPTLSLDDEVRTSEFSLHMKS